MLCDLLLFTGLEVTRYPEGESVSLDTDRPLLLTYMVCGTRHDLERFRFKVTVSQDGIGGGDVKPQLNGPLVRDDIAEARGISASLWNYTSPDYEMCNEVAIRVWTDHSKVVDSTIELKLGISIDRIPREYPGGEFRLYYPEDVVTTEVEEDDVTSDSELQYVATTVPSEVGRSSMLENPTQPNQGNLLNCSCYCDKDEDQC